MIGGFQSSRELSAASMKAYSSAKSRQAADRALEMARLTQQFKEDTEKKNQPTSGSAYDKALSDFLRQGGTSYDAQLRLRNAGEAFDYAQGFSSQHKMSGAALRALSSDNGIIGQYGATSQFAIKNAGQDAVNARKAEIAQLQLTNKLVADMTPEQEKQVRQDAEMAASAKQKNDWLQTQLQTTKQIALEDKQRANARSVSRLGLPSELAAAELERRSAKDSLDNDRSVNGMTPEDYKQRLAEINRKYSDVKNNYTSDSAQSFLNSNIGQRNDLMAQAAMPVGDTGYLAQAKQEIYQLEHQTDAYGKAIGKALDPKYKDAILEQATAMDTYAKSIDTATQRWMAQKGVVDDINSAIQTGITDWRAGIKELGDDVMKMATGSISSYLTSKLLPHNQEAKDLRSNSMNAVGAFSDLVSGRSGGTSKARTVSGLAGSGVFFGAGSGFNSAVFPSLPTWVPNMQSAASNQYSMMAGLIPGAGGSGQMNASTVIVNGTNVNVNGSGIGAALTAGSSPMSTSQGFAGFAAMLIPSMVGGGSTSSLNGGTWV